MTMRTLANKESVVRSALKRLLECVIEPEDVTGMRRSIKFGDFETMSFQAFESHEPVFLIAANIDNFEPTRWAVRENLILKATSDIHLKKQSSLEDFLSALECRQNEWCNKERQTYMVCASFDAKTIPDWLLPRRVLRNELLPSTFKCVTNISLADRVEESSTWLRAEAPMSVLKRSPFITIVGDYRDCEEALDEFSERLELVRASLNWAYSHRTLSMTWGRREARALHHASAVYVVFSDNSLCETAYGSGIAPIKLKPIDANIENLAVAMLDRFCEIPEKNSSATRLKQALLAFGAAVDNPRAPDEFLGLWITLETLANVPNGTTSEICKRISMLWVDGEDSLRPRLESLAPVRNRLVHQGEFDHQYEIANMLLVEATSSAIARFAHLSDALTTDADFQIYFSNVSVSDQDLERRIRVCNLLKQQRGRPS